ncbi:uncharacterized protein LOC114522032 [Dendronephthya gigantea]|uniref:uncharacterized protein LOC114522032 n=1 Tax=Dendronephthya gigantea TaxID=151771 RepID=UPI00106B1B14|nr:uncharacterized protein LOC114522032 [Dendronephthya gigantea]
MKSNVSFPKFAKSYPTPLLLAAGNGNLEVVKYFHSHGATFDSIILHHTAARNQKAVLEFVLDVVGLRDTCKKCQPKQFSKLSLTSAVKKSHTIFCETALHAAVSRGLIEVAEILLAYGTESLECRHHSGKTVLMDAVEKNDTEMVDLLLKHGANVSTKCGRKILKNVSTEMCSIYSMYKQDFLYTMYCFTDSCECDNRVIHISAKYGLWKMAKKIASERILDMLDVLNCDRYSALSIAVANDQARFVQYINDTLKEEEEKRLVALEMVKKAVEHCSADVAKLNYFVDFKDEDLWSLLWQSIRWSPCGEINASPCLMAFRDSNLSDKKKRRKESERRLNIIRILFETHHRETFVSYKLEKDSLTFLHLAASNGFDEAVKYLVELGADTLFKDSFTGLTPLMSALVKSPVNDLHPVASYRCYTTKDGQFRSCHTTCYDETSRYLIQVQKASISKCDANSASMLRIVIEKRMPLSLYALLKIGVDISCRGNESLSPLLLHLKKGGHEVSDVLKIFEASISVKCGMPHTISELHRLSFVSENIGNFFKPRNKSRSPMQRLIDRHPNGVRILNYCFDAEGYLPIHRAAQGGNLAAIRWFKNAGVDMQLKTRSGFTAFDISILYLGDIKYAELIAPPNLNRYLHGHDVYRPVPLTASRTRDRRIVFQELMLTFFSATPEYRSEFPCGSAFKGISPLHIAAVKGISVLQYVHKKAAETFPGLPINCTNAHRLDPVYLAYFYDSVRKDGLMAKYFELNPHFKDSFEQNDAIYRLNDKEENPSKNKKGLHHEPAPKLPDRVVDYFMVHNYLYHPPLREHEYREHVYNIWGAVDLRISDCPGYFNDEEAVTPHQPPNIFECSKIRVRHDYYLSLCMQEIHEYHARTHNCPHVKWILQRWLTLRKRKYRRPTQLILNRMGLSNDSKDDDITNRFPYYFLHKLLLLNEYNAYEYLKILNKALEISDVRFHSPA